MIVFPDIDFLHSLADAADLETMAHFRTAMKAEAKGKVGDAFDPVTEADRAAEVAMREMIAATFPDHAILGEEFGTSGDSCFTWVLDPIDGTRPFISGIASWGTLIGFVEGETARLGMVSQPFTEERFWASPTGAWRECRGERFAMRTRQTVDIAEAVLNTTSPDDFDARSRPALDQLASAVRMTRYGGECYAVAMLAAGFIDLNFEPELQPHDVVALIPIVEQAGGVITTLTGGRAEKGGAVLASANPVLHEQALRILNGHQQ